MRSSYTFTSIPCRPVPSGSILICLTMPLWSSPLSRQYCEKMYLSEPVPTDVNFPCQMQRSSVME